MATHPSVLAWRIPGTGEPDGLPSMGSYKVGHDWSNLAAACIWYTVVCIFVYMGTYLAAATAKSLQSCPTLCDPIDGGSPLGCPVPGILQARTLEWVTISFSNAWKWKVKVKSLSRVRLLATPWTAAYQAPPSMGFSRQEYWSGMPLPSLRKDSGMNENEYTTYQNLWDAASVVLRGNFIAVNAYIKKKIHLKLITWPSILRN